MMSKSLKRVRNALDSAGVGSEIVEVGQARTAAEAAASVGCQVNQIAKSIIFEGARTGRIYLFLTAGANQVDLAKAEQVAGEPMARADAAKVREVTGFAIGGVAPVGHLTTPPCHFDPKLSEFDVIWAAAGTPRHVFSITPGDLRRLTDAQIIDFVT